MTHYEHYRYRSPTQRNGDHIPNHSDVHAARRILNALKLPTELALEILDYARYWPEITHESAVDRKLFDEEWSTEFSAANLYLWAEQPGEDHPLFVNDKYKLKEIEWLIVSHDQGWTTENTLDTYKTSSWWEVSILRPDPTHTRIRAFDLYDEMQFTCLGEAREHIHSRCGWTIPPRPSTDMEPQRMHCRQMQKVGTGDFAKDDEGKYAWYLQGNQVARATSVFEGDMVKRYRVVWGCAGNPRFEGNEGAGRGEGFIEALRPGDYIGVWARAKRRGWENKIFGVRMTLRYNI